MWYDACARTVTFGDFKRGPPGPTPVSQTPAVIGRYQVVSRLGQGGMGFLYLAWDPMLDRQIAVKLLRDDNDELRERFAREARSVAKLRHPNIVTIFDVGEQDGRRSSPWSTSRARPWAT